MKRIKLLRLAAACLASAVLLLTGCSGSIGNEDAVTIDFLEDTVFTVADCRVGLAEWYLYALPRMAEAESMYGGNVWNYRVDSEGTTLGSRIRDDIREQITYVKIVCAQAERLGIALNEDDMFDINIQTDDYMNKLTAAQKQKYGITSDIVQQVYSDNLLAMKVYENLTLNIDTNIPDEEVRHMFLEYIMILKHAEDDDATDTEYSAEELETIRTDAENFLAGVLADKSVTRLDEVNVEGYSPIELIADYATLQNKLPGDLAGIAFSLRENEINGLYETDDAFFIFDCVARTDEDSTNEARIRIIEQRQKELFAREYSEWEAQVVTKLNYKVWDKINEDIK